MDVSDPSVAEAWQAVRDDASPVNYCVLTYAAGSNNQIVCSHAGSDGLEGLFDRIRDDDVTFGGLRVTVDGAVKFFAFGCVGEEVGGMKRGRAALHQNAVVNALEGIHGTITAAGRAEMSPERLVQTIRGLTGGHVVQA